MSDLADQLNAALAGRYAIQRELGTGGMATVYLAEDLRHRRPVAIKVLHAALAAVLGPERFLREIEIAARLTHPHILPLYDSGTAAGLLYYVMPYAEDQSLRQRLEREKQLPVAEALLITCEVADALDYAHRRGVVHRDIKPENILLEEQHALVADFGIARAIVAAGSEKLTTSGLAIGTPLYMSPEQGAGSRVLDGRSDVYSLGCVLYEMLAGQPPFTGPTAESLAHQHLNLAPRPVTDLRPTVPEPVGRALKRTLAKAAADRFRTAAEFAAAITASAGVVTARADGDEHRARAEPAADDRGAGPSGRTSTGTARGRRLLLVAASAATLIVLGLAVWRFGPALLPGRAPEPGKRAWMLVAEFEGPREDSLLAAATRDLVIAALEQSEIVATVAADQIRLALQYAGKPVSTRVDAEVARELAYRSAVRSVLEGRVGRLGQGYSLVLRVVDADSAKVLVSVSDAAKDEQALIPTVDRIARKLRAELGEHRSEIQGTREILTETTTPSFEAFKLFRRAQDLAQIGHHRAAITVARSALALDPDFARAWGRIGVAFTNLNEPDSALGAFRHALAHPERLDEGRKLAFMAQVALHSGDFEGALALSERLVQLRPQDASSHGLLGSYLDDAGRPVEALESFRAAAQLSPFGPDPNVLGNQFVTLLALGRLDEAQRLVPTFKGNVGVLNSMRFAAAAGQWSAAESLATALGSSPTAPPHHRGQAWGYLAAVQASRGQVRAAEQTMQSKDEANLEISANGWRWTRISLTLFSRGFAADPGDFGRPDSTTDGLLTRGVWAAAAGDTTLARRLLATVRSRSAPDLARQGFNPALLEAWIAARAGHWQEVLRILAPAALQGEARGYVLYGFAPVYRWLAAEAWERLDRPDSAAAFFERAIAPSPDGGTNRALSRTAFSFGHRRLVLLYAHMGRLEAARRHWEIFSQTFTHPDPEMQPLIEEARAARSRAEAMAKSARR